MDSRLESYLRQINNQWSDNKKNYFIENHIMYSDFWLNTIMSNNTTGIAVWGNHIPDSLTGRIIFEKKNIAIMTSSSNCAVLFLNRTLTALLHTMTHKKCIPMFTK